LLDWILVAAKSKLNLRAGYSTQWPPG
jgi:hypothetical protein